MKKSVMKKSMALLMGMASAATIHAATVVKLQFNTDTTATNLVAARLPDVDASNEYTIAWSDSALLFDGVDAWNQDVYGAYTTVETPGSNNVGGAYVVLQDTATGSVSPDSIRFDGLNSSSNLTVTSKLLLMWDSADFLTNGFNTFDTRLDSYIKMGQDFSSIVKGFRFVIREGDSYYICNKNGLNAGLNIYGTTPELKWGEFDVNNWASFDATVSSNGMGVVYTNMVFTNVTAVGVIAHLNRNNGNETTFRIRTFEVGLVDEVGTPPPPVVPVATVVDLDTTGFAGQLTSRTPDFDDSATTKTKITYEFNTATPFFTEPGTNATPIYGGWELTGTAGTVNKAVPFLASGNGIDLSGTNKTTLTTHNLRTIMLWDSADFLASGFNTFNNTADSSIEAKFQLTNAGALNLVVRDGSNYYISSQRSISSGGGQTLFVTGLDSTWAQFDPAGFKTFSSSGSGYGVTTNAFVSRVFTNVTGVGVIGYASRGTLNKPQLVINDLVVKLVQNETDGFAAWAQQWLPADVSDPAGDNDGDQLKNLAEYAINGNPTNAADRGITANRRNGSQFEFIHAKLANDESVTYRLIDTTDLVLGTSPNTNNWDAQTVGPVVGDYQMVTNSYSTAGTQKFIELEIEK